MQISKVYQKYFFIIDKFRTKKRYFWQRTNDSARSKITNPKMIGCNFDYWKQDFRRTTPQCLNSAIFVIWWIKYIILHRPDVIINKKYLNSRHTIKLKLATVGFQTRTSTPSSESAILYVVFLVGCFNLTFLKYASESLTYQNNSWRLYYWNLLINFEVFLIQEKVGQLNTTNLVDDVILSIEHMKTSATIAVPKKQYSKARKYKISLDKEVNAADMMIPFLHASSVEFFNRSNWSFMIALLFFDTLSGKTIKFLILFFYWLEFRFYFLIY